MAPDVHPKGPGPFLLFLASLLAVGHAEARAQPVYDRLEPGARVLLETEDGRELDGTFVRADSTSVVVVDASGDALRLSRGEIETAWERVGSTGRFAAGGATIGGGVMGTYLALLAAGLCDAASCEGEGMKGFMVGAPIGAAGGALVGAVVGSLIPRWIELTPSAERAAPGVERSVHLGLPRASVEHEPRPVSMLRAGIGKGIAPTRSALIEVSRLDFTASHWLVDPTSPISPRVERDATTWTLALGLAQGLGSGDVLRATASVGLARSTVTSFIDSGTYFQDDRHERAVQYSSQISVGAEATWAAAADGALRVGFEGRYDYIPLLFDGLQVLTLSVAIRG